MNWTESLIRAAIVGIGVPALAGIVAVIRARRGAPSWSEERDFEADATSVHEAVLTVLKSLKATIEQDDIDGLTTTAILHNSAMSDFVQRGYHGGDKKVTGERIEVVFSPGESGRTTLSICSVSITGFVGQRINKKNVAAIFQGLETIGLVSQPPCEIVSS